MDFPELRSKAELSPLFDVSRLAVGNGGKAPVIIDDFAGPQF